MMSLMWTFVGALVGLVLVSVFTPPPRKVMSLPTPENTDLFHSPHGCLQFETTEVECMPSATSLNFIASEHK
jgi:hypothetical protein